MLNLDGSYKQENYESYGHELVEFSRRSFELSRSTEPADRELMERHVRTLYKWLDKREPSMVWCDSPLQIFALPYIIDCYAKSGDVSWEQVWMQAEERYFSRLPDSVLYNLDLDRIKDRISTLCLDRRCGYRLQDAIDVNRVLELRLRQLVSMKYASSPSTVCFFQLIIESMIRRFGDWMTEYKETITMTLIGVYFETSTHQS